MTHSKFSDILSNIIYSGKESPFSCVKAILKFGFLNYFKAYCSFKSIDPNKRIWFSMHDLKAKSKISALSPIDKNRILSEETLGYLDKFNLETLSDLDCINSKCYFEGVDKDFYLHTKSYELDHDLETTWNGYLSIPPSKSWCGSNLSFSFAYDNDPRKISYADDKYTGMKDNQLIFIVIKLLFGIFKLAVTHYVSKVSHDKKTVKLCYVDGGKSSGSQIISFEKISENKTLVLHNTHYKSDSKFRDEKLYPFLHEMIINQFHNNVKTYLNSK